MLWRIVFNTDPPWNDCCVEHDLLYWAGGESFYRTRADLELYQCVLKAGYPRWATLMWIAVRIGGHPLLPLPWRWGYGWNYWESLTYAAQVRLVSIEHLLYSIRDARARYLESRKK